MKTKKYLGLSLFVCFCLCFSTISFAHTMWLNVSDYSPEIYPKYGARTKVYFDWGHHYPVDDFLSPENLDDFSLIRPNGDKEKLSPNPGGFLATGVSFKGPGAIWYALS